jgi:hypothetical protein
LDACPVLRNTIGERRVCYGKTNSMGDLSYHSQDKGEEGEKTDPDGLLQ